MSKEKSCFVCKQIVNNFKLDENFRIELVNLIKDGCKIDDLIILYNELFLIYNEEVNLPTEYYLKNHQIKCLKLDLKNLYDKRKFDKKSIENNHIYNNCVVCTNISNNTDLNVDLKIKLDSFINQGYKIDELISFYNEINNIYNQEVILPNKHYLEKHQMECLKLDLKNLREKRKFEKEFDKKTIDKVNNEEDSNFYDILDLENKIKLFNEKTFDEQEIEHLKMLREIKYMTAIIIHHEILNCGKQRKGIIPKDDIMALKNIEDIIKNNDTNFNDMEEKLIDEEERIEMATSFIEYSKVKK